MFCEYYATAFTNKLFSYYKNNLTVNVTSSISKLKSFYINPVSNLEIFNVVMSMENKHSFGIDEIPIKLVKNSIPEIGCILNDIYNLSFETVKFPDLLKISIIKPILKKGVPLENYRPLSLLP